MKSQLFPWAHLQISSLRPSAHVTSRVRSGGIGARGPATLLEWGAVLLHLNVPHLLAALAGTG